MNRATILSIVGTVLLFTRLHTLAAAGAPDSPEATVEEWVRALDAGKERRLAALHATAATFHAVDATDIVGPAAISRHLLHAPMHITDVDAVIITPSVNSVLLEAIIEQPDEWLLPIHPVAYIFRFQDNLISQVLEYRPRRIPGCQSKSCTDRWREWNQSFTAEPVPEDEAAALAEAYVRAVNEEDRELWESILADDVMFLPELSSSEGDASGLMRVFNRYNARMDIAYVGANRSRAYTPLMFESEWPAHQADLYVFQTAAGKIRAISSYESGNDAAGADAIREEMGIERQRG